MKTYNIGNKEIKFDLPDGNYEKGIKEIFFGLTQLLEALSEKKEDKEEICFNCGGTGIHIYEEEMKPHCKVCFSASFGKALPTDTEHTCSKESESNLIEPQLTKNGLKTKQQDHKWTDKEYPTVRKSLTVEEPKSTLRKATLNLIEDYSAKYGDLLYTNHHSKETADKIISLFKDTLLKEVEQKSVWDDGFRELSYDEIKEIIQNL